MKFLLAFVSLLACFLSIEAHKYHLSVGTSNYGPKPINGDLLVDIKSEKNTLHTAFNDIYYNEYINVGCRFSFDEEIKEIVLYLEPKGDKNAKMDLGPIVLAKLGTTDFMVFKPNNQFISGNQNVSFTEFNFM